MTRTTKTITSSLVVLLGLTALSTQANAGISTKTFMESVPYTQEDLQTTEGVAAVHERVIAAARNICIGDDIKFRNTLSSKVVEKCVVGIADQALTPAKYDILASYHASLSSPARVRPNRFVKTDWTVEKFQMAQMDEPKVNALP